MPPLPSHSHSSRRRISAQGFSLFEVVIALALFAMLIPGMLALMGAGMAEHAASRRESMAMQLCSQVEQALKGFRKGTDDLPDSAAGDNSGPGLLDAFLPFDFARFPAAGHAPMVLGFDADGKPSGRIDAAEYTGGSPRGEVAYFVKLEGTPVTGQSGVTGVIITVEYPAGDPAAARKARVFHVWMVPGNAGGTETGGRS